MAAAPEKKMITLRSSEEDEFVVDEAVAMMSVTVKNMIEDDCADTGIPLLNVNGRTLAKVIEYCRKHAEMDKQVEDSLSADHELQTWDEEYVKVDQSDLFDLILAANYLDIKGLLDLTCLTVANMMKGKSPEEIRAQFNIVNDYTPEEEAEVRKENQWAFE